VQTFADLLDMCDSALNITSWAPESWYLGIKTRSRCDCQNSQAMLLGSNLLGKSTSRSLLGKVTNFNTSAHHDAILCLNNAFEMLPRPQKEYNQFQTSHPAAPSVQPATTCAMFASIFWSSNDCRQRILRSYGLLDPLGV
jgi:hypothetical protein